MLKDADTLSGLGSAAGEVFAILPEAEVPEYIQELLRDRLFRIPSFWEIFFGLVVGVFFIVFSFPKPVMNLGKTLGWSLVFLLTYMGPTLRMKTDPPPTK